MRQSILILSPFVWGPPENSYMGLDAYSAEEFWLKYGHEDIPPREHLFRLLFFLKHTPPQRGALRMLGGEAHRVCSHLNGVVAEIQWVERMS